jgi:hypothetical protein
MWQFRSRPVYRICIHIMNKQKFTHYFCKQGVLLKKFTSKETSKRLSIGYASFLGQTSLAELFHCCIQCHRHASQPPEVKGYMMKFVKIKYRNKSLKQLSHRCTQCRHQASQLPEVKGYIMKLVNKNDKLI